MRTNLDGASSRGDASRRPPGSHSYPAWSSNSNGPRIAGFMKPGVTGRRREARIRYACALRSKRSNDLWHLCFGERRTPLDLCARVSNSRSRVPEPVRPGSTRHRSLGPVPASIPKAVQTLGLPVQSATMAAVSFNLDNSYARDLQGFSVPWRPEAAPAPKSLFFNELLAQELGLDVAAVSGEAGAALFAGNTLPEGAEPIAQAYAGHQFGGFSPQLGDGRAVLLGEVIDRAGRRRDIALKGSGRTPFSRGGDGKAAVGPMLREVLIGEAMHAFGIPTTRALAVVATGEPVLRETVLPGAVLTRVAASHIRVGTFQFFAARAVSPRAKRS